jgi:hypothetical protein
MTGCYERPTLKDRATRSQGSPSLTWPGVGFAVRLLFVLLAVWGSSGTGFARDTPAYAGIVIRPGDGTVTYAYVPLDEEISGIELLRRSGVSLVTIGFGGLGEGVCQIEETGCEVGPCRTRMCQTGDRDSPYWRYFQADADGDWVASPLGGSGTKVEPGDVDGWSWTPDEALLPEVGIDEIPRLAGAGNARDEAHFARYDENGNLLEQPATLGLQKRSYAAVIGVMVAVGVFGLALRLRARSAA